MQKRKKSLIRWIILICFLLSTVSALTIRHFTMTNARSVHATHLISSEIENNSSIITFEQRQHTEIGLANALTTHVGRHASHTLHHAASSLGKNLKNGITASRLQPVQGSSVQPTNGPSVQPVQGPSAQPANGSAEAPPAPNNQGKVILISISNQWMYIYQDGKQIANTAITTGRPGLDTPLGSFHIFSKESPTTFYSMWPAGSANYFEPTHINFALEFLSPGYFIHDSLWRHDYGPGSNTPHMVPAFGAESGSHGCVNVPYSIMPWLYNWADINTPVDISE